MHPTVRRKVSTGHAEHLEGRKITLILEKKTMHAGISRVVLFAGLLVQATAFAQAPAGAPAGATGICKDGSYSTAATKSGACRGHKGVQDWYAPITSKQGGSTASAKSNALPAGKSSTDAPAPVASKPATASAPTASKPAPPMPSAQATAPMPNPSTTQRTGEKGPMSSQPAAPGGGAGMVWVNTASNVYHCPGTAYYGKTKAGAYMSEADAKAKGARADAGRACTK
jgi:Protein of unknown function (DUF3761)